MNSNLRYRVASIYVENNDGRPLKKEMVDHEYYRIDDYNQNNEHWFNPDIEEDSLINRITKVYTQLKEELSKTDRDGTLPLEAACSSVFEEHFPARMVQNVYNAYHTTRKLIQSCQIDDELDEYIKLGSSESDSYHYSYTEMNDIISLPEYNSYSAVEIWRCIRDYFRWILEVHDANDMLPIFFQTVVEHEDECALLPCGTHVTTENENIVYSDWHGSYQWRDDCIYVENRDDWIREEETAYCDDCDEYRLDTDECSCEDCRNTSDSADHVNDYHCSPNPQYKGILEDTTVSEREHLQGLKRFSIGFEIEKSKIEGSSSMGTEVEVQPFFAGWETDSSCGVEGISHIYSLDDYENISKDINRSEYLDICDTNRSCGGHINIHDHHDKLRYWHLSAFMGIFYALWRYRLNRNYCSTNKKLNPYNNQNHYNVIGEKSKGGCKLFEIRIPSAVTSADQLKSRYLMVQQFIQCVLSFMNEDFGYQTTMYDHNEHWCPDPKVSALVQDLISSECYIHSSDSMILTTQTYQRCRYIIGNLWHILEKLYRNNREKLPTIVFLTYCFQHWIDGNNDTRPTQSTSKYL
jgi:hypothetical protein